MRPAVFVPEALPIGKLLAMMQLERVSMVIVLDEYGATSGLVTIEDIVEEIFGDITDEYDDNTCLIEMIDDIMLVDGSYLIDELNAQLGTDIPQDFVDTIGGFMFLQIENVPQEGDRVEYHGWEFIVQEMDGRRVSKVKVCKCKRAV